MSKVSYENSMWVLLDDDGNRHSFESKHELEEYLDLCEQHVFFVKIPIRLALTSKVSRTKL